MEWMRGPVGCSFGWSHSLGHDVGMQVEMIAGTRCLGAGDVNRWDAMWNGRDGLLAALWVQAIIGKRHLPTSLKEGATSLIHT